MKDLIQKLLQGESIEITWGENIYVVRFGGIISNMETGALSLIVIINGEVYAVDMQDIQKLSRE